MVATMPPKISPETMKKAMFCQMSNPVGKNAKNEMVNISQQNTATALPTILPLIETMSLVRELDD